MMVNILIEIQGYIQLNSALRAQGRTPRERHVAASVPHYQSRHMRFSLVTTKHHRDKSTVMQHNRHVELNSERRTIGSSVKNWSRKAFLLTFVVKVYPHSNFDSGAVIRGINHLGEHILFPSESF